MAVTLISEGRVTEVAGARHDGDALWIPIEQLEPATGWHLEPEGMCRDERCVPLPPGGDVVTDDEFDYAGFARHMRQAVARSDDGRTWAVGAEQPSRLAMPMRQAPDFELPGLDGRQHRLSDYRGKKVFLATWASW